MADPTTNLPRDADAIEAEIRRVEEQLQVLKHAAPQLPLGNKHGHSNASKSKKRKLDSTDTNTSAVYHLTRPSKHSASLIPPAHLDGELTDIAGMSAEALAVEIAAVENDLLVEYARYYAEQFTDSAAIETEMARLKREIDLHTRAIETITQPKSRAAKGKKDSKKGGRAKIESVVFQCQCQQQSSPLSLPLAHEFIGGASAGALSLQCSVCQHRYHPECHYELFQQSKLPLPCHAIDLLSLHFVCVQHGAPELRLKTPDEIESEVREIRDAISIEEQVREMESMLQQVRSQDPADDTVIATATDPDDNAGGHSDPALVQRVRSLMTQYNMKQSDVVRSCTGLSGGASTFSCWINDRRVPQRERKEIVIREWCDRIEAELPLVITGVPPSEQLATVPTTDGHL